MALKLQGDNNNSGNGKGCPACGYQRKEKEEVPEWQCPKCGVAYNKINITQNSVSHPTTTKSATSKKAALQIIQHPSVLLFARVTDILILLMIIIAGLSFINKNPLPYKKQISQWLYTEPVQKKVDIPSFTFNYRKQLIEVKPMAEYELWGLIVSQNTVDNWLWGYNPDDVNFKDICVIWGWNLMNDNFHHFKIWNQQWTCNIEIAPEYSAFFDPTALSNNHLLSDNPKVRDMLWKMQPGDQIFLKGYLVNYQVNDNGSWRNSSLRRDDTGNGACEVFLVEEAKILSPHLGGWLRALRFSLWALIILVVIRVALIFVDIFWLGESGKSI